MLKFERNLNKTRIIFLNGNIFLKLFSGGLDETMTSAGCKRERNNKKNIA